MFLRTLPLLFCLSAAVYAEPVVSTAAWQPACDGSNLEVVSDHGQVRSVRATADHFAESIEWSIHYIDDLPVTAEFRISRRDRFQKGEHAGEPTGTVHLISAKTWQRDKDHFAIEDGVQLKELDDLLKQARAQAAKAPQPVTPESQPAR